MCVDDDDDFEMVAESDVEDVGNDKEEHTAGNDTLVEDLEESRRGEADDIKILVATDIHVGYGENKPKRYLDSVDTFEEVLQIAVQRKVDMIVLGGDLFHENNPTRDMQHRVVQLLRKYCLNDNEVSLEFLSDPSVNFQQSNFDRVNYEDGNLNVGLPIFTIHGNHDDMAGKGLTALDLLHEAGLVNLFGKFENIESFEVSPILLRKGNTKLALFGIGSQRDDRLRRAFQTESIKFLRPQNESESWFNMFVLHQNRPRRSTARSTGAYLPEEFIPSFFDLVIWGHEHECKPRPQFVASSDAHADGFWILQPGSTIATSLSPEEGLQKNVFQIKIRGRKFKCTPIPLQTTRQVIVDQMTLDKLPKGKVLPSSGIRNINTVELDEQLIRQRIEALIEKAKAERGPRQPPLPLIRLKVSYAGPWAHMQPINVRRVGAKYDDQVANALEMIVTRKVTDKKKGPKVSSHHSNLPQQTISASNVEQMLADHFSSLPWHERLSVITHGAIGKALTAFADDDATVVKANKDFGDSIRNHVESVKDSLKKAPIPELKVGENGDYNLDEFEDIVSGDLIRFKKAIYAGDTDDEAEMSIA